MELCTLLVGMQNGTATMENSIQFLKKLPYDSAIPFLDMNPRVESRDLDIYTPMFIAASFTIAKAWKPPKCPSRGEWRNLMWNYPYNGILFSLKKKKILANATTGVDLD